MEKTNKIYKILKIVLIVLLIFGTIKSCAQARVIWTNLEEWNYNGNEIDLIDDLLVHYWDMDIDTFIGRIGTGNALTNFNTLLQNIHTTTYPYTFIKAINNTNMKSSVQFDIILIKENFTGYWSFQLNWNKNNANPTCAKSTASNGSYEVEGNINSSVYNKYYYENKWYKAKNNSYTPIIMLNYNRQYNYQKNISNIIFDIYYMNRDNVTLKLGQITNFYSFQNIECELYKYNQDGSKNKISYLTIYERRRCNIKYIKFLL